MERTIQHFYNKYRFNSLMCVNFLKFFLIQLFIFLVIAVVALIFILNTYKKEVAVINQNQAIRVENLSETIFSQVDHVASIMSVDSAVVNYANRSQELISSDDRTKLKERMINYKNIVNYIDSIYIYSTPRNVLLTNDGELHMNEFSDALVVDKIDRDYPDNTQIILRSKNDNYPDVITYVKDIKDVGYVIINIDYSEYISQIRQSLDQNTNVYLLNNDNEVVFENETDITGIPKEINQMTQSNLKDADSNEHIYTMLPVGYYNQKHLITTSYEQYHQNVTQTVIIMILILLLFAIISILIAVFMTFSSFSVIMKLYDIADSMEVDLSDFKNNEAKHIATKMLALMDDNKYLKEQLVSKIENYNEIQLVALQQQINPHFLGNVLSAISLEIVNSCGCETPALNMLVKLTRITRYSFENNTIFATLKDETGFIDDYIVLLRGRFGDFKYICEMDEELYDIKIPKLGIQPLIENAVYHGIGDMAEEGEVKLCCKEIDGKISIEVRDNGVGMSADDIKKVYASLSDDTSDHVGIGNVYKRLKIIYGNDFDLKIESKVGEFTKISVILPKE